MQAHVLNVEPVCPMQDRNAGPYVECMAVWLKPFRARKLRCFSEFFVVFLLHLP